MMCPLPLWHLVITCFDQVVRLGLFKWPLVITLLTHFSIYNGVCPNVVRVGSFQQQLYGQVKLHQVRLGLLKGPLSGTIINASWYNDVCPPTVLSPNAGWSVSVATIWVGQLCQVRFAERAPSYNIINTYMYDDVCATVVSPNALWSVSAATIWFECVLR